MTRSVWSSAVLLAGSLLSAAPAFAGSVVIWPVDPTIKKGERATAIWVENQGVEPMTVQVRAFAWSQPKGEEALTEQDELVASPPIATVPGGQRQLVRVIRRTPAGGAAEGSYRLLIDELPAAVTPDQPQAPKATLGLQMRYSIPLFAYTADAGALDTRLTAVVTQQGDERLLVISNAGSRHARLVDLRAGDAMLRPGLVGYALAGQTLRVLLPAQAPTDQLSVTVDGARLRLSPGA